MEALTVVKGGIIFASIRRYKTVAGASRELARLVQEGFVPIISKAPGFVAYYAVDGGMDVVASVSLFENQAGAEESSWLAADWVKKNTASLITGPPEITACAVIATG